VGTFTVGGGVAVTAVVVGVSYGGGVSVGAMVGVGDGVGLAVGSSAVTILGLWFWVRMASTMIVAPMRLTRTPLPDTVYFISPFLLVTCHHGHNSVKLRPQ